MGWGRITNSHGELETWVEWVQRVTDEARAKHAEQKAAAEQVAEEGVPEAPSSSAERAPIILDGHDYAEILDELEDEDALEDEPVLDEEG